jgi:hypothetical protein
MVDLLKGLSTCAVMKTFATLKKTVPGLLPEHEGEKMKVLNSCLHILCSLALFTYFEVSLLLKLDLLAEYELKKYP